MEKKIKSCLRLVSAGKYSHILYHNRQSFYASPVSGLCTIILSLLFLAVSIVIFHEIFQQKHWNLDVSIKDLRALSLDKNTGELTDLEVECKECQLVTNQMMIPLLANITYQTYFERPEDRNCSSLSAELTYAEVGKTNAERKQVANATFLESGINNLRCHLETKALFENAS